MTAVLTIALEAGHQTPQAGARPGVRGLGFYLGCQGLTYPAIVVPAPTQGAHGLDPDATLGCFGPYMDHGKVFGPQVGIGVYDPAWLGR